MARETASERLTRMTERERELWRRGLMPGGVDEAGRGPLAGPVVAACVIMPPGPLLLGVNDSKKVAPARREELYEKIRETALTVEIALGTVEEIESLNIRGATRLAMERAVLAAGAEYVLVDAEADLGIFAKQQAIVHGDAVSYQIAAASIAAKVYRDRLMQKYDEQYPQYGFAKHKGYGTRSHIEALLAHGPCPIHRRLFLRGILGDL